MTSIQFFGQLSDVAGDARHIKLPSEITTMRALLDWLSQSSPELQEPLRQPGIFLAIDNSVVGLDANPQGARELVIGSVISGG